MNPLTLLQLLSLLALAERTPFQDGKAGTPQPSGTPTPVSALECAPAGCPRHLEVVPVRLGADAAQGSGCGTQDPDTSPATPRTPEPVGPVGEPWVLNPTAPTLPTLEEQLPRLPFLIETEINMPNVRLGPFPPLEHNWIPTVFPDCALDMPQDSVDPQVAFEDLLRGIELNQEPGPWDGEVIPHIDVDWGSQYLPNGTILFEPVDSIESERRRNQGAFDRDYLGEKELLMARHPGEWVAIAEGHVLPVDAYGHIEPTPNLDALLAQLALTHPGARHRFIFRVGEEGRVNYHFTMYNESGFVGWSFLMMLEGGVWTSNEGVFITPEKGMDLSTAKPIGPAGAGTMTARLAGPDGQGERDLPLFVATAYGGSVVLDEADATDFGLQRWEIPGVAFSEGRGEMRRARVRVKVPGADFDADVPVSIWAR